MSANTKQRISVEVWGANIAHLLDIPNVEVSFSGWKGCDDSCPHIEHDPIAKKYLIRFPSGTCTTVVKNGKTDYALPDGTVIRIVEGGDFYDKVLVYAAKKS